MKIKLCVLGLPGSGKNTVGELLKTNYPNVDICDVGSALRQRAEADKHIKDTHKEGGLVSSDRVMGIFEEYLAKDEWILLGSPRRPNEAQWILDGNSDPGYLVYLKVPYEVAKQRLLSRGRFDDTEEVISRRFADFETYTMKSIELYQEANRLIEVDATRSPEEIVLDIRAKLLDVTY